MPAVYSRAEMAASSISAAARAGVLHQRLHRVHDFRAAAVVDAPGSDAARDCSRCVCDRLHPAPRARTPGSASSRPMAAKRMSCFIIWQLRVPDRCAADATASRLQPAAASNSPRKTRTASAPARPSCAQVSTVARTGLHSGPVPGDARQMAALGPASVAVHDDGDVRGQAGGIDGARERLLFIARAARRPTKLACARTMVRKI